MSDLNINQNEQAREAEKAVLGGLMLETHRFDTVIQVIKENDFDGKDHQIIFQSMSELIEENKPLDPLTVSEKLTNKNSLNKVRQKKIIKPSHGFLSTQKFDFVASETIRSHFPSLIQPYMVWKYSFRGFRN